MEKQRKITKGNNYSSLFAKLKGMENGKLKEKEKQRKRISKRTVDAGTCPEK